MTRNLTQSFVQKSNSAHPLKNTPRHLLVIRLSAMGDVAMTVPVLIAFTEKYPDIKITLLTRAFFSPIFSSLPNVSVYEADVKGRHKGIYGLWRLSKELKRRKIDAVIDLHNVLRSQILDLYLWLEGLPIAKIDKGRAQKRALTRDRNKVFEPLKTTHERYADVFRKAGFPLDLSPDALLPRVELSGNIAKLIKQAGKRKLIGIAPFAAFPGKMYPLSLMEEVIRELKNTKRYKIVLFGGGKAEKMVLQKWADQFSKCTNIAGKLTFEDELKVISNLDLMLAMDSGNAHLAAMYGVPVVTLWGVTHPFAGFYPFAQDPNNALLADRKKYPLLPTSVYGKKMPKGYQKTMETIRPIQVVAKIDGILKAK